MYRIEKAAVIGAGTMGLGIAGQLANANIDVLLLDLPGAEMQRNAMGERALERLVDKRQPGLLHADLLQRISIGNIEDDMHRLAGADWIAEAGLQRLSLNGWRSSRNSTGRLTACVNPGPLSHPILRPFPSAC